MPDPIDLKPVVTPVSLTASEALEYLRAKGFAPPEARFDYRDWWGAKHAKGFVVAKATQDDLLRTFIDGIDRALAEGRTFEQFRTELEPELKRQGWWGKKLMRDPLTGEMREVQLGSARRLRVIFDTNMRTSYAAGRWVRIQRVKDAFPYLQYLQVQRPTARAAHKPFHELVLPVDHPFWATHFPPNGWFCLCTALQLTEGALERRGLEVSPDPEIDSVPWTDKRSGRTITVPKGVTPGFDTNPGAVFLAEQGRYDAIAGDLSPQARGVEQGLIAEARARGLRTGTENLAAMEIDPNEARAIGSLDTAAPVDWATGVRDEVRPGDGLIAAMRDPARSISVIHNHPDSPSLSSGDLSLLESFPGLIRVIAVGHDGSLYRASLPKPGPGQSPQTYIRQKARPLREEAEARIVAIVRDQDFDKLAMARLSSHATASVLARRGMVDYAHSIAGGSLVNLIRFGEDRMERLIAELVEWLTD